MATGKKFCKDCHAKIERHFNCIRCKECQKEFRRYMSAKNKRRCRKNKAAHRDTDLGTTDFSPHMKEDFEDEAKAINEEMKRLGLR
jgi:hypothetical protein